MRMIFNKLRFQKQMTLKECDAASNKHSTKQISGINIRIGVCIPKDHNFKENYYFMNNIAPFFCT